MSKRPDLHITGAKAQGQQFLQGKYPVGLPAGSHDHIKIRRITELHHDLTADAAGTGHCVRDPVRPARDGNGFEGSLSFADRFEESGPFRAKFE